MNVFSVGKSLFTLAFVLGMLQYSLTHAASEADSENIEAFEKHLKTCLSYGNIGIIQCAMMAWESIGYDKTDGTLSVTVRSTRTSDPGLAGSSVPHNKALQDVTCRELGDCPGKECYLCTVCEEDAAAGMSICYETVWECTQSSAACF